MAKRKKSKQTIQQEALAIIYALIAMMLVLIGYYQLGILGIFLNGLLVLLFGQYPIVSYLVLFVLALTMLVKKGLPNIKNRVVLVIVLAFTTFSLAISLPSSRITGMAALTNYFDNIANIYNKIIVFEGGLFGVALYALISALVSYLGAILVSITLGLITVAIAFMPFYQKQWKLPTFTLKKASTKKASYSHFDEPIIQTMDEAIKEQTKKKSVFMDSESLTKRDVTAPINVESHTAVKTQSAATLSGLQLYSLPSITLLDDNKNKKGSLANQQAANLKGKRLIEILNQFQIQAELISTHIGPAVTKFEVRPDSSVKISKIASLSDNIKMELQAKDIRIEAPIPGKNAVGVEIPNVEMTPVRLLELIQSIPIEKKDAKLLFILGKDLMGKPVFGELDKMPHLLIAGATGSGKSVAVNSIITTLLLRSSPNEVKLVLIDPKKVEFTAYHDLPHLICPVVSDATQAAKTLKIIVSMMENRYEVFSKVGVRNITGYNEKVIQHPQEHLQIMPWIVVIIDELADLMIVAGKEVEASIQRITQLARAAGIHLIVATQRPSVDVITGIIKSNIPSRIAFAVSSGVDSRTILDHVGAERLLGYGDMLYVPIGEPNAKRIQGVFVSDDEVKKVAQAAIAQGKPHYDDAFIKSEGESDAEGFVLATQDPLYEDVKAYVIQTKKASTSMIQRRFALGYNRAARIMDGLENEGIIGPSMGSRPRDVYGDSE